MAARGLHCVLRANPDFLCYRRLDIWVEVHVVEARGARPDHLGSGVPRAVRNKLLRDVLGLGWKDCGSEPFHQRHIISNPSQAHHGRVLHAEEHMQPSDTAVKRDRMSARQSAMDMGKRAYSVHIDQARHEAVAREIDSLARRVLASCIFSRKYLHNLAVCDCDAVVFQKVLCAGETAAGPHEPNGEKRALLVCTNACCRQHPTSIHLNQPAARPARPHACSRWRSAWRTISFNRDDEARVDEGIAGAGHAKRGGPSGERARKSSLGSATGGCSNRARRPSCCCQRAWHGPACANRARAERAMQLQDDGPVAGGAARARARGRRAASDPPHRSI